MQKSVRNTNSKRSNKTNWIFILSIAALAGFLVLLVLGYNNTIFGRSRSIMGAFLLAGSTTAVGGFLGFLFGIPRSVQGQLPPQTPEENGKREYTENTNLEQISDWLTKIIVGLTLVQFPQIRDTTLKIGENFGPVMISGSPPSVAQSVAVAVILYFLVIGFLFSYLWTRIHLETVLLRQNALLESELNEMLETHQELANDVDVQAFDLTDSYLDLDINADDPKFVDLEKKIASSSLIARTMIFDRARKIRRRNWKPGGKQELVDRTIPVFKGLIAAARDKYHRNYGQLGYALVTSSRPDWNAAKNALEKAIALRGDGNESGMGYYEFNLAIALINMDKNFNASPSKKSNPTTKEKISGLLDAGGAVIDLSTVPLIEEWGSKNGYRFSPPS